MAQTIKLRRSSTEGKVPTTSQLSLGEIAINTYDGRVFFEKNDGSATIQHIVTTDSITTGSVSIVGQLTVDDITINGSTISDGGDLTLDANGDIILDANGADIKLEDNGTAFGRLKRSSSDFVIKSDSNNNDIIFKGVDNSSTITALTLDMSDAGTAIFEHDVKVVGNISGSSFGGTGLISGAAQITSFGNLEIANPTVTGTLVSEDVVRFTGLSSATEATSVMINGSNELVTRELGSNAFTSTTITPDGGNADQVDGLHASSFIRSDATDTATGALTFTGDSKFTGQTNFQIMGDNNAIFISSSNSYDPNNDTGKLFIGGYQSSNTSNYGIIIDYEEPVVKLDVELRTTSTIDVNSTTQSTSKSNGCVQIAGGVGIAKTLNVGEDVVAYASSDERYKDLITPIQNPNEKIKLLSGNTFVWNDKHEVFKGKKDIGVIAQEVEKVLPEIVETRDNGYKAVKYEKIVALLIESNKELIKRVEELESKIK